MIEFTKMEGLENDYIYIDYISNDTNLNNISDLAKFISNRITSCEERRTIWKLLHDK